MQIIGSYIGKTRENKINLIRSNQKLYLIIESIGGGTTRFEEVHSDDEQIYLTMLGMEIS